jgi:hypothetical protein
VDKATRDTVEKIPLLSVRAGPRDAQWVDRMKQELTALIKVSICPQSLVSWHAHVIIHCVACSTCNTIRRTIVIGSWWSRIRRAHGTSLIHERESMTSAHAQ